MLTGKTIGQLTNLVNPTSDTLLPVELNGLTYHINFSAITRNSLESPLIFPEGSRIESTPENSGDGSDLTTLSLKPDASTGDNRYVVLDPTGPNHIHIRAGGTIDQSNADLYIGGEKHYVRVSDNNQEVYIKAERTETINGYFFTPGNGFSTAEWTSDGNTNNFITINDPTQEVYDATQNAFSPSILAVVHNGNYVELTVVGIGTPGMPQPVTIYVQEAPPAVPTILEQVNYEIRVYRNSEIEIDRDIDIRASDDLRLYSYDTFALRNYSGSIDITTNYDDGNNEKTWQFNTDGSIQFPNSSLEFSEGSSIISDANSAGDGSGLSTLILKPDTSTDDNRYVVLDPTGPNHIHIRAGGTIDQSQADLIIGGENNNLLVSDSLRNVQIKTKDLDVEFIGYIDNGFGDGSGATLHVTNIINGTITDGMTIYGPGIPGGYTLQFGTVIAPQGNGGIGNYYLPGGDFLTTSSTYIGTTTISNWTFGGDGIIKLNNGIGEIYASPDNGLVRIGTGSENSAPNAQIILGGPDQILKIVSGPPLREWTFEGNGDFNLNGNINGATNLVTTGSNTFNGTQIISGDLIVTGGITGSVVPNLYLIEAYADVTYTLPSGFTDDPCRYSIVNNTVNVPSNWFNTSTYRFTPQKAGYWEIIASYDVYRNSEASIAIRKNGGVVAAAGSFNSVAQQVTKIVYLNGSTDFIDVINTGGAQMERSQFDSRSWFQARWVGE